MSQPLRMLDLCCGLGGASKAMVDRGWDVVTVDTEPRFNPTILVDIRHWSIDGHFDLVWASVPCTEYARESMPWCRTGNEPDHSIWHAAEDIIRHLDPRWWCIENVRGAQKWMGKPPYHFGPVYLWTNLFLPYVHIDPYKEKRTGKNPAMRSLTPYVVSLAVAESVEEYTPRRTTEPNSGTFLDEGIGSVSC